ncbi:hypothetical protein [Streptomyces sp. NBC_01361]|uniref:hypothetical protein n=1 Tax=Streptomyces sp. NBC_01361 TaxID=2903838 RepID=UPI002E36D1DD|nr:hypothetical protein [Streptomyces sp. NBC_01361]
MRAFKDPQEQAIWNWLNGTATRSASDIHPSPACMPSHRPARPRTPRQIAEDAGLVGLFPPESTPLAVERNRTIAYLLRRRCRRNEVGPLADRWLAVCGTFARMREWAEALGPRSVPAVARLRDEGIGLHDLDVRIDGIPARRRLRNDEAVEQIIAALRMLREN